MMNTQDYISLPGLLKATPAQEGGERFVYLEASNEALDQQGEVVLAKALEDSADYFKQFGNLDIDHYTQIGPKMGMADSSLYELGRPVEVSVRDGRTYVKGQIYQGSGPSAAQANYFWDSLTGLNPPQRWYPSVGGSVLEKSAEIDPDSKRKRTVVSKVRWSNVGFSKTPVNANLPVVSAAPFGPLAKSWGAALAFCKSLDAGYGTDSATLTGGGALRGQSLDHQIHNYWDFRDALSKVIKAKKVKPDPRSLSRFAMSRFRLEPDQAAQWIDRFYSDLRSGLRNRRHVR